MFGWITGLGMTWITVIALAIAILGGVVWYVLPILLVRRHDLGDAADRLHHEDSARKTVTSAITGFGVVVPFAVAAFQWIYTQHMERDEKLRNYTHEIGMQFLTSTEKYVAAKNVGEKEAEKNFEMRIQLIYDLERMALSVDGPPEHFIVPVADNLKRLIGEYALFKRGDDEKRDRAPPIFIRHGCKDEDKSRTRGRDWRDDMVRAAFGSLGRLRAAAEFPLRLDELQFDNIDVSKRSEKPEDIKSIRPSFANAHFFGGYFRRADLTGASFEKVDFREAHFGDIEVPGFNPDIAARLYKDDDYDEIQRYRCWIADFRGVALNEADFRNANLAGVDFSGANLKEARFDGAEISRADFRNSNVTLKQLCSAKNWDVQYPPKSKFGTIDKAKCPK